MSLVLRLAVNAAALWLASALWDGVSIHGWAAYLIGALVLGIANAIIKPVLTVLTLPLIVLTLAPDRRRGAAPSTSEVELTIEAPLARGAGA